MDELSDQLLLRRYCQGDQASFDALFRRYAARVHATAYRMTANWEDADDTLQEVFLALARSADRMRRGESLAAWLYRTTINRSLDCLRRRKRTLSLDSEEGEAATPAIFAVESLRREAEQGEARRRDGLLRLVEGLIPRLPEQQASVMVLRGFQGLTHREIGVVLGCSESNSKAQFSLACRKLREWVAEAGVDDGRVGRWEAER